MDLWIYSSTFLLEASTYLTEISMGYFSLSNPWYVWRLLLQFRSSRYDDFCKKTVLRYFTKLQQNICFGCFLMRSCELCKIFQNRFFIVHLWMNACDHYQYQCFTDASEQVFYSKPVNECLWSLSISMFHWCFRTGFL